MQPTLTISLSSLPTFNMIYVEGGEFLMGSDLRSNEQPIHNVKVADFYIGKYQVTQQLWQAVMKNNPSRFQGEKRPVERVSWLDTKNFYKKLNAKTGKDFRLPTEAEWEYAARGGIFSQGYTYAGSDKMKQVGWYDEHSDDETRETGLLRPNELGLYDMSGNVWEWCEDWYDGDFYKNCKKQGIVENPVNTVQGGGRVLRGGSCFNDADGCRSAHRFGFTPDDRDFTSGFRPCLSLQSVG